MDLAIILRWAVILFFAAWLLITLLAQPKGRVRPAIKSYDVFSLIPIWSFFAPRPANSDLCLMFRDIEPSGALGPWQAVETNPPRRFFHILWNPQRRTHGVLLNLSRYLPAMPGPADFQMFKRSVAHDAILNLVKHLPVSPPPSARQFCFMVMHRTFQGQLQSKPLFLSDAFRVGDGEPRMNRTAPAVSLSAGSPA